MAVGQKGRGVTDREQHMPRFSSGKEQVCTRPWKKTGFWSLGVKVRMVWDEAGEVHRCVIFFFGKRETVEDHMPTGT